jgi:hypothetical protein
LFLDACNWNLTSGILTFITIMSKSTSSPILFMLLHFVHSERKDFSHESHL